MNIESLSFNVVDSDTWPQALAQPSKLLTASWLRRFVAVAIMFPFLLCACTGPMMVALRARASPRMSLASFWTRRKTRMEALRKEFNSGFI